MQRFNIGRGADDALTQAEAKRKVLQILRCRHHHRVGATVLRERDRGLFWNRTIAWTETTFSPGLPTNDLNRSHYYLLQRT